MKWFLAALMLAAAMYGWFQSYGAPDLPDGVLVADPPAQTATQATPFQYKGLTITPLADFAITARVVSTRSYLFDAQAVLQSVVQNGRDLLAVVQDGEALSPLDLGLSWGQMSDNRFVQQVDFAQAGRFLSWRPKPPAVALPFENHEFNRMVANMHMIPANHWVREVLMASKRDHIVSFKGYLVRISNPQGFYWSSSLSRDDTGDGACEVVWVTQFRIHDDY